MQKRRIASHLNDNMPSEIHRSQDSINDYYISACYALMPKRQAALEELGNVLKMLAEEHIEKGIPLTPDTTEIVSCLARRLANFRPLLRLGFTKTRQTGSHERWITQMPYCDIQTSAAKT